MKSSVSLFGTLALTALAACSSAADGTAAGENDLIVKPVGNDMPGAIVVALPANLSKAVFDHNGHVLVDNQTATVNTAVSGLPVGKHNVTVNGCTSTVDVQSGQTTTVTLGALAYTLPKDPTFGLTVIAHLAVEELDGSNVHSSVAKSQAFHLESCSGTQQVPANGQLWAVPPGSYSAVWGFNDGTPKVDVASGQAVPLDLGSPAGRRLVRVHAPASRDLPQAQCNTLEDVDTRYQDGGWLLGDSEQPFGAAVDAGDGTTLVVGTRSATKKISLRLPFTTTPRALPLTHDAPSDVSVGRLDVTDVAVTLNDGSSKTYAGHWSPAAQDGSTTFSLLPIDSTGEARTQTGLDVWPGTYVVSTDYVTVEEGKKTTTQNVTVQ